MASAEQLVGDTLGTLRQIATHFELAADDDTLAPIVDAHSFKQLTGGRASGDESDQSFFRKGVAGDWVNQFTPEVTAVYKRIAGPFLVEFGYEQDEAW